MCLILLALEAHPRYPLIIAANRDEFFNRKTLPLHEWDVPEILGGKDLVAGGTWLGIDKKKRISAITNFRDLKNIIPDAPSRGRLTYNYLIENIGAYDYLKKLKADNQTFNGYNLLLSDENGFYHFSNYENKINKLENGIHGLSNALLNTPWPKVELGKEKLSGCIENDNLDDDSLFNLLYDSKMAADEKLPSTGVPIDLERNLSSMFIKTNGYGTRCSSVIKIDHQGIGSFAERTYDEQGNHIDIVKFPF